MDEVTLREHLHRMAAEVGTPDAFERRTIGRARRRRTLNAVVTLAIVAGVVAAGLAGARAILAEPGTTIGVDPTPEPSPTADVTGVPESVATTAQAIIEGADARDFDALAALLDPNTFIHELGDASDPIPSWRADPSVLDLMVLILQMQPTSRDIDGSGTFYFWPYLVNADFTALTQAERTDLRRLGYSDADIELMIQAGHGYQGPRLAIDETGLWRNFLTVGE